MLTHKTRAVCPGCDALGGESGEWGGDEGVVGRGRDVMTEPVIGTEGHRAGLSGSERTRQAQTLSFCQSKELEMGNGGLCLPAHSASEQMFLHGCARISILLIPGVPGHRASQLWLSRAQHPKVVIFYVCHRQRKVRKHPSRCAHGCAQCNLWVNPGAQQ